MSGNKQPADLFKEMDEFQDSWIVPDVGAYAIVFLTFWHSFMYLALGNPVCTD